MSSRQDVKTLVSLPIDFSAIGLEPRAHWEPYFCTPEGAEPIGWILGLLVSGIVFCGKKWMGRAEFS